MVGGVCGRPKTKLFETWPTDPFYDACALLNIKVSMFFQLLLRNVDFGYFHYYGNILERQNNPRSVGGGGGSAKRLLFW